ncbi:BPSS1780 family membrane protein [Catenovulum sediminis]|uniref:BPSS1780 family membrane protein n=1 Tax=Catenovulum sediminis TaxID=1740262 RepID=UPI00117C6947|nr:BPSS1780 family membrane protein [Catenovulum sediminis]
MQPLFSNTKEQQITIAKRPARAVFDWFTLGFKQFNQHKLHWIILCVLMYTTVLALTMIPLIGEAVGCLLLPGFFTLSAHVVEKKQFHFEAVFSAIRYHYLPLLQIFAVNLLVSFICVGIASHVTEVDLNQLDQVESFLKLMQVAAFMYLPFLLIMVLASALVVLHKVAAFEALKYSAYGCIKNLMPLFVFCIFSFFALFLAVIPMLLGLLVFVPIMHCTLFIVQKEIFVTRQTFKLPENDDDSDDGSDGSLYV